MRGKEECPPNIVLQRTLAKPIPTGARPIPSPLLREPSRVYGYKFRPVMRA